MELSASYAWHVFHWPWLLFCCAAELQRCAWGRSQTNNSSNLLNRAWERLSKPLLQSLFRSDRLAGENLYAIGKDCTSTQHRVGCRRSARGGVPVFVLNLRVWVIFQQWFLPRLRFVLRSRTFQTKRPQKFMSPARNQKRSKFGSKPKNTAIQWTYWKL